MCEEKGMKTFTPSIEEITLIFAGRSGGEREKIPFITLTRGKKGKGSIVEEDFPLKTAGEERVDEIYPRGEGEKEGGRPAPLSYSEGKDACSISPEEKTCRAKKSGQKT